MLDTETKRRIDSCRDILVGKVPDPKSQVEQITIALIYKFMDDMDAEAEEFGGMRTFFAGEYAKYGWSKLMAPNMGGFDMLALYSEAIQKMNENPGVPALFREIFKNAYLPYRDPETLRGFLKEIDGFTYDHSERLGDAFEYLLSVLGSQGDAGQFRTPRHIIDFMVEIIDPKKDETVLDTACGTAGFLISSYKHILKHNSRLPSPSGRRARDEGNEAYDEKGVPLEALTLESPMHYKGDLLTPDERKRLAGNIKGYDISPDMVRLSLVNLYLHGFSDPHIFEYDTLTSEERWNEYADIILANPPFMSPKGGIRPHKRFSMQATRSEVLFVDYIAEHLTPNGRAAVVVPEGIIFQSGTAYKKLREMLVKNSLVAVISLPAGVFNPYSGVKTSILVMDKKLAKKTDAILFAKIVNDGYNLGAQRRPIDKNDLPEAARLIKKWLNFRQDLQDQQDENNPVNPVDPVKNNLAFLVSRQRIGENGEWNLSMERYREIPANNVTFDMVELGDVFLEIKNGINVEQLDEIGKYRVTRIQTIADGTIDLEKTKWTNDEVNSDRLMQWGDILFSHINSIDHLAKTAIYTCDDNNVIHGINLIRFRPDQEKINPLYASYLFKQDEFREKAKSFAQRAVNQASIKVSDLKTIQIPLPPLEVQKEIVAEIEGYQKIIDGARQVVENYQPRIHVEPDWPMVKLGAVISLEYGKPLKSEDRKKGSFPVYGSNGIVGLHDEYLVEGPAIIVGRKGSAGAINYSEQSCFPIDTTFFVRIHDLEKLDLKFCYFQLSRLELDKVNVQAGVPGLNRNDAYEKQFFLPDIDIQRAIVARIEEEQRLVNANKELIQIFETKIKSTINRVWGEAESNSCAA